MRKTFVCDDSIIISIPIRNLKNVREGQLMPENFHCVFKDHFKVLAINGKPKPVGAAQATVGMFIFALGLLSMNLPQSSLSYTLPSFLFVISGMVSYAAGNCPNMYVAKLSFSLNIISFFWSLTAISLCIIWFPPAGKLNSGLQGLIISLLTVESIIAIFLIYWMSKVVCRQHFNTLPTIMLKEED
ncbi:uncharacterized protein PAE49_005534 [Odontesthes bonariensis]|uniref:uncharacterized protein LOC142380751 n=1 Tax=Odontesthes bonariensis TaxID=219752 RepID=UPI003F5839F4